jgi:hypothetical protein
MFEFERPPFDLSEIDKRIGRMAGQTCFNGVNTPELLCHGLTVTNLSDLDIETALGHQGYEYMIQRLSVEDPELVPLYTPEHFAEWQHALSSWWQQAPQLPGRVEIIPQPPVARNIFDFLMAGYGAVIVPLYTGKTTGHLALAYGISDEGLVNLYWPTLPGRQLFRSMTLEEIDMCLIAHDGISAVSL